ncbi:MAG: hypothetical protein JO117_05920, partial [Verrucomicrobia bacterium]|nr:hypothetical protein [Verrucomicrobiota bacterium]
GNDRLPAERYARAELRVARPDLNLEVTPKFEKAAVRPGERVAGSVEVRSAGAPVNDADVTVYAVDDAVLALGSWEAPEVFSPFYPVRRHAVKTYAALPDYVTSIERKSLYQKGFVIGGGGEEFGSKFVRKDFRPLALWQTKLRTDAAGRVPFEFTAPDNLTRYRLVAIVQTNTNQFGEGNAVVEVAKPLQLEPSLPRFLRVGDTVELRAVARQSARDNDLLSVACVTDAGLALTDPNAASAPPVNAAKNAPAVFRFKAKVADVTGVKVTFTATSAADPSLSDSVEITLAVLPPTVLRHESVAGTLNPNVSSPAPDLAALLPAAWKRAATGGHFDLAVSTSQGLPRLQGLPAILQYPHGCFEQISTRVLAYSSLEALWASVPTDGEQQAAWRAVIERQLRLFDKSLLDDGSLPYWPGGKEANAFVTIQAAWAVNRAANANFTVPEGLAEKFNKALTKIIAGRSGSNHETAWMRAFALLVQPAAEGDADAREQAAKDLFLNREPLGDEGRALLALALQWNDTLPQEKLQLLRELDTTPLTSAKGRSPRAFDPRTFSSDMRAQAIMLTALTEAHPPFWDAKKQAAARARLEAALDHAPLLSTQENLWTLIAYGSLHGADKAPKLKTAATRPDLVSTDGTAVAWVKNDLARSGADLRLGRLAAASGENAPLYYLLGAEFRL